MKLLLSKLSLLCGIASYSLLSAGSNENLLQLTQNHIDFAFSLHQTANPQDKNFIFSPYSISSSLSMIYLGARGETQSQMEKVLRLEIDSKSLAKAAASLAESLSPKTKNKDSYQLINANSLWVDQSVFLLTDFRYAIEKQFKASLNKLNFTKTKQATDTINQWVDQRTEQKIPQILSEEDINALTRLVLVNALYFEGKWNLPFDITKTQDWPFHPTPGSSVSTKMMQQTGLFPYYENELIQIAALSYQGKTTADGEIGLVIVLPKSAENFTLMQTELPTNFKTWLSSLNPTQLELKIPKFTQNTRLDLNHVLQEMGMQDAFNSDADFTGIDGMRDLSLNKAIHQSYFSIDEQGSLVSSATALVGQVKSTLKKEIPISFYADHPFLYFIVDLKSLEILFMGNMAQPGPV